MGDIFVTGHRNPDTDSIVAALAYANPQNALGERSYNLERLYNLREGLTAKDDSLPKRLTRDLQDPSDSRTRRSRLLPRRLPSRAPWETCRPRSRAVWPTR